VNTLASGPFEQRTPTSWPRPARTRGVIATALVRPHNYVDTLVSTVLEVLEPIVAELREFNEVPIGVIQHCAQEIPGVFGCLYHRHILLCQFSHGIGEVKDCEGQLHRSSFCPTIREVLDRMDREVNIAEGATPMGLRPFMLLRFERNSKHITVKRC
jgi:hypothetical protein